MQARYGGKSELHGTAFLQITKEPREKDAAWLRRIRAGNPTANRIVADWIDANRIDAPKPESAPLHQEKRKPVRGRSLANLGPRTRARATDPMASDDHCEARGLRERRITSPSQSWSSRQRFAHKPVFFEHQSIGRFSQKKKNPQSANH